MTSWPSAAWLGGEALDHLERARRGRLGDVQDAHEVSTRRGPESTTGHRGEQDLDVARERPAGDVLVVEPDHLLERDVRAPGDLPRPGEAGAQIGAARLPATRVSVSASAITSGRGPTRLMSPLSTLSSCGASSSEKRRISRPTRVIRASSGS